MNNADALTDLGRRAVACPRFRWTPGMLAIVPPANNGATGYTVRITEGTGPVNSARAFPDLADAATLGALLGLVREVWGDPKASIWYDDYQWGDGSRWTWRAGDKCRCEYDTEAETLIYALEAAP